MYKIDKGLDGIVRINGDEFVVKELIGIEDNSFRQYEEYSVDHQCCRQCVSFRDKNISTYCFI